MTVRNTLMAALALCLLAGPAAAQSGGAHARFAAIMDEVFGPGAWRMTGGYRTPEREDQLRAQGAATVRPGGVSRHSLGTPAAPGAYDLVVAGLSPHEAAERLRRAGAPFARYQPKGAHGTQGAHLHLEPWSFDLRATGPVGWPPILQARHTPSRSHRADVTPGFPVVTEGLRRTARAPEVDVAAEPAVDASASPLLAVLRVRALGDDPDAQIRLARAYAEGDGAPKNLAEAMTWLELAAGNPRATAEAQTEARNALARMKRRRQADRDADLLHVAQAGPGQGSVTSGRRGVIVIP
ncbi:hypothetical protein [Phenylobacterium sp. SCN 70-31]|uniref:hypothetical protein n=1 Tax=Phenylobacterium sp. SCN 70-31 TaxID=1660129 RepID=UPI00086A09D0|nr:hypothetical protein [Phenylobacterium sp. SCN 70-31]ODT88968.1 MAG: hypothetical protein ABS78_05045 [Phenylobacterium sp. SCN 70-31]